VLNAVVLSSLEGNRGSWTKSSRFACTYVESTQPRRDRHVIVPVVVLNLVLKPFYVPFEIGQIPKLNKETRLSNPFHHHVRWGERRRK
jgi:hypothetical protein